MDAPSHHQRARHAAAGKPTVANVASCRQAGTCAPVTALRARATRLDSSATRTESPLPLIERTADRWVPARW